MFNVVTFGETKKLVDRFGKAGVDVSRQLERASNTPAYAQVLAYEAYRKIYDGLDDKTKVKRGDYYRNPLFEGGDKVTEKQILDELIISRSSAALSEMHPDMLFTDGLTHADFACYLMAILSSESPNAKKLWSLSEKWFEYTRAVPDRLYQEGLISAGRRASMLENQHYAPRMILRENPNAGLMSRRFVATYEPMCGGSLEAIEVDSAVLLENVILRTEQRIANNRAILALIDLCKAGKLEGEEFEIWETVNDSSGKVPYRHSVIKARDKGMRIELIVPDWFSKSWKTQDPAAYTIAWSKRIRIASFSSMLRETMTGALNPLFLLIVALLLIRDRCVRATD